ncbi:hypothetical protein Efla_003212 [Eimeria flavescens]
MAEAQQQRHQQQQQRQQQQQQQQLRPHELLVSAALSGLVTKTACAPMDRLRLLYQVQGMLPPHQQQQQQERSSSRVSRQLKYKGIFEALQLVVKEEGIKGLWRGNAVNALRAAASYAMKFPANDLAKRALSGSSSSSSSSGGGGSGSGRVVGSLLLAGAVAGSIQKTFSYPLDLLSVRVAIGINSRTLGTSSSSSGGGRREYGGVVDCVRRIWKLEGPSGFFKGYSLALWSGVPYVMLQMTFFDIAKHKVGDAAHRTRGDTSWASTLLSASVAGSFASMGAQAIVFPLDTIRKRIMSDGIDGGPRIYGWNERKEEKLEEKDRLGAA